MIPLEVARLSSVDDSAAFLARAMRPLQFPSLGHLDERVQRTLAAMASVEKLSLKTQRWIRDTFRVFRTFLGANDATARRFLGGDLRHQVQVLLTWIAAMHEQDLARSTVNNYWRAVRLLFERIAREDMTMNPFAFVKTPHPGFTEPKFLTQREAEALFQFVQNDAGTPAALRARNAAIFAVMLLAGLRRGDVLALKVANVDFDSHVIRIERGKGRHGGKPRTVPMTPQLERICAAYFTSSRQHASTTSPQFFLGTRGRGPLSETTLRRFFARISRRTETHVTPHMLRHTFCTLLSRAGVADRLAREAMGHADLKTLQRYQHIYQDEVATEMTAKLHLNLD